MELNRSIINKPSKNSEKKKTETKKITEKRPNQPGKEETTKPEPKRAKRENEANELTQYIDPNADPLIAGDTIAELGLNFF